MVPDVSEGSLFFLLSAEARKAAYSSGYKCIKRKMDVYILSR